MNQLSAATKEQGMSKKRKSRFRNYVNHPRYGDKPIYSGLEVAIEDILSSHWSYKRESIFPESVVKADVSKQNYSMFPRQYYVDIEKTCAQCGRWFLFYAQEQKYWYEELQFYIDADCIKCIECRKSDQAFKAMILRYEVLVKKSDKSNEENNELKNIVLELFKLGYIKNVSKIGGHG